MNTYILKENQIDNYYNFCIKGISCVEEAKLKIGIMGLEEIDIDEAKKNAEIGDCLLFEYDNKMLPFQLIHKFEDSNEKSGYSCVMSSYYVLDNHIFDENTNVWKDASIRKYMNEDMLNKFDNDVKSMIKEREVHTDNYVTKDKIWLLSHEEIGYKDDNEMFKENKGAITFDYYKEKNK